MLALHRYAEASSDITVLMETATKATRVVALGVPGFGRSIPPQSEMRYLLQFAKAKVAGESPALRHCGCCKTPTAQKALKRCSRCQWTYYCSEACQRDDWRQHKKDCYPLDAIN